jgi:hypothetical protein
MASWKSYLGMHFPPFLIEDHIARGGECEVYSVRHCGTGRVLALRLPFTEDQLWEAEPMCPPVNTKLEKKSAQGAFLLNSAPTLYGAQPEAGVGAKYRGAVHYYGIRDGRYLIPLSAPYRVNGAIDIEVILDRTSPGMVAESEFFQDLVLGVSVLLLNEADAGKPSEDSRLPGILADPTIHEPVAAVLRSMGTHFPKPAIRAAMGRLKQQRQSVVALESNLLVRLCVLSWSGLTPEAAGGATAKCQHFRSNVTLEEISQFVACCRVQSEGVPLGRGARFRLPILAALKEQPIYPASNPEAFTPCVPAELLENPYEHFDGYYRPERFSLFMMEKAGLQSFLDLAIE